MNILIVTGSPRKGGNTEIMAGLFAEEAEKHGHTAVMFRLSERLVLPCRSCGYCRKNKGKCLLRDDMDGAFRKMQKVQVIVIASPIYDHGFPAQMASFFNRLNAYNGILRGPSGSALLLNSGLPDEFEAASKQYAAIAAERKWTDCGIVAVSGMNEKGDMRKSRVLTELSSLIARIELLPRNGK